MRVLLVEDDPMIGAAVQDALRDASYAADWLRDGLAAMATLGGRHYDLVLLDLGLPGKDGLQVLAGIRAGANPVPLLIITARHGLEDRLRGLDGGADDYVAKPFQMAELLARMRGVLLARMRAVLRRKGGSAAGRTGAGVGSFLPRAGQRADGFRARSVDRQGGRRAHRRGTPPRLQRPGPADRPQRCGYRAGPIAALRKTAGDDMVDSAGWFYWALLSAVFAALTAIFAKVGIQGVDSDLATLIRTAIIIVVLSAFVACTGKWSNPLALSPRTWLFLGLSGLATGASWVCYFRALKIGDASKVAPVDKLSLVLVAVFAFAFLGERPSLREWSGIAMVAAGVVLLAFKR